MLKNYFEIAIRNLFKNKLSSLISITGLALGIAGSLVLLLFVLSAIGLIAGSYPALFMSRFRAVRVLPPS